MNHNLILKVILSNPIMYFRQDGESVSFLQYFMPTASRIQNKASYQQWKTMPMKKSIDSWHKKTLTSPYNNFGYKNKPFKI